MNHQFALSAQLRHPGVFIFPDFIIHASQSQRSYPRIGHDADSIAG
ncbi:hypothetical protein [Erwinia pyrifoliae]|nr:hypothetical protein [Erwinia pyrifoliae]